jgi:uncharacterized membrane protein HdeD (DUF308 family)
MSSTFDRIEKSAHSYVTKLRWALGLNGALAIAAGVVILLWPGISLYALTLLFGAFALARGLVGIVAAFSSETKGERGWVVFTSILNIAVGIVVLVWTGISALALLYVIGAYAIVLGVITIVAGFWLPIDGSDSVLSVVTGLISILFGIVIFASPEAGALATLTLIAAFLLIIGISELVVAIGGKRLIVNDLRREFKDAIGSSGLSKPQPQPKPQPQG